MGVNEAAVVLGMARQSIRKAIARGTLEATLVPGGRRGSEYAITGAAVDRYLATHRRPGHRKVALDGR